jgi:inosine/xanthosine triphosphate pyrophosphatase family protein
LTALLLATTNPAKAERLRWVFSGLGFEIRQLEPLTGPGVEETGESFRQNAELKASYWSARNGGLAAATDGGLVIPGLGARWNALRTARAAGPAANDLDRARHLLALAAELQGEQRFVHWVEALALARDGVIETSWEARGTEAVLVDRLEPERIRPGFWAASLCYLPARQTTLADLDDQALAEADPTWSRLRDQVRAFVASGQLNLDLSD